MGKKQQHTIEYWFCHWLPRQRLKLWSIWVNPDIYPPKYNHRLAVCCNMYEIKMKWLRCRYECTLCTLQVSQFCSSVLYVDESQQVLFFTCRVSAKPPRNQSQVSLPPSDGSVLFNHFGVNTVIQNSVLMSESKLCIKCDCCYHRQQIVLLYGITLTPTPIQHVKDERCRISDSTT